MSFEIAGKRVWVAGHNGLVGRALVERLNHENCKILTVARQELDLRDQKRTDEWIGAHHPDLILIAAAKVGGIGANAAAPADFINDNLSIAQNIIHAAYKHKTPKLVFLGSSCIYPKFAAQPIIEEALLTGELEPTNEAYAIAKIAGIKLCQFYRRQYGCDFISLMPCNIYGPNDLWNSDAAHVIPSLISKIHAAKTARDDNITLWGSGEALREFLYVDDLADAVIHCAKDYSHELHLNIGSGEEVSIKMLAEMIKTTIGFESKLCFDRSKPDGTPRKLLDSGRIRRMGWVPKTTLQNGLELSYQGFLRHT